MTLKPTEPKLTKQQTAEKKVTELANKSADLRDDAATARSEKNDKEAGKLERQAANIEVKLHAD
jgi:hypothetical protein